MMAELPLLTKFIVTSPPWSNYSCLPVRPVLPHRLRPVTPSLVAGVVLDADPSPRRSAMAVACSSPWSSSSRAPLTLSIDALDSLCPGDAHRFSRCSILPQFSPEQSFPRRPPLQVHRCTWPTLHSPSPAMFRPPTGAFRHGDASEHLPHRQQAPSRPEPSLARSSSAPIHDRGPHATIEALPGGFLQKP